MRYFLFILVVLLLAACDTNTAPTASFTLTPEDGELPLEVSVTSTATDAESGLTNLIWDWGDGSFNEEGEVKTHTYTKEGTFTIKLTVTDTDGAAASSEKTVTVTAPELPPAPVESSGSLDKTFSEDGFVVLEPRSASAFGFPSFALGVKEDGGIVTAINDVREGETFFSVVAGLKVDGSADETLGRGGFFQTQPFSRLSDLELSEDAIHSVGQAVVSTDNIDGLNCGLYLRLGVEAQSSTVCDRAGNPIEFAKLAADSSGRLIAAYLTRPSGLEPVQQLIFTRTLPDGTPDSSFGVGGQVTLENPEIGDFLADMLLLPDDQILLLAVSQTGPLTMTLARFSASGELQQKQVLVLPDVAEDVDETTAGGIALTLDNAGKVLVAGQFAGQITVPPDDGPAVLPRAFLARLDPATLTLDNSFGREGLLIRRDSSTDTVQVASLFADLEVDSEGRIVVVGAVGAETTSSFLVERYLDDGTLDQSFGQGGQAPVSFGDSKAVRGLAFGVALAPDGKIVVAGQVNDAVGVARLNP
jgi:uncharacterized delta-60 repeat protein